VRNLLLASNSNLEINQEASSTFYATKVSLEIWAIGISIFGRKNGNGNLATHRHFCYWLSFSQFFQWMSCFLAGEPEWNRKRQRQELGTLDRVAQSWNRFGWHDRSNFAISMNWNATRRSHKNAIQPKAKTATESERREFHN